ncbi:ribose-phosphate diphosphokinase [Alkalilimnicola ehrlichii MLHE-1]|uniref:ribose-phosphate diphosphokinase n=1 Tax=Alkalilimnicola ehrlichii (strain ATCC BAA-1101 / DSM 17681 / MLHE-1) TaxID=187272 RepID=Q0A7W0_ALKEH|nr:ribose-phosphate pyrophosphokinase [Alkalilimnicola ehrlichii]ABI57077.1 ribose-phosphate pyrophosphokinase [Alkalilimnicola ehrlichii MLHE-1]
MKLFALNASRDFGARVAEALGSPLAEHEEREFEDGEHKARPLTGVRGEDVYVLQSLHGDPAQGVNERLARLLFFLATVRQAGAARVTAVIPYLAYARKDRQTKPRDPVTTRYLAQLLEAMGIDAVITLEVHNRAAFQNAFRCQAHPLDTRRLFAAHIRGRCENDPVVVASPDPGGVKRAQGFQETLAALLDRPVGAAFVEKRRSEGVVSGEALVGDVAGASVWLMDDLISSGGTLARAAAACRRQGAARVVGLAAHGLFTGDAGRVLSDSALERILITDTVPPDRLDPAVAEQRLEIVSAAPLFAEAIRRTHKGGSLTELLEGPG